MDMEKDKNPVLEVNHLSICFDLANGQQAKVVEDISFSVYKEETVALVGESGSGKSITSLAVMGLLPIPPGRITSGSIRLNGQDLLQMKQKNMSSIRGNEISMIFQEPMTSLDPVFKVSNQMIEGIRRHQAVTKREGFAIALRMLKEVGIANAEKVMHEYPHQLSGGMRQRVMIAMAMANNPKLLIADEPTTALDVTVQAQILRLMLKMKREHGSAILFITHDMGVVAETADRVMVMYAGQIVEEAPVKTLFTQPKHPYTAALLQTIPSLDSNVNRLPSIPGTVPSASQLPNGCRFAARCKHAMSICSEKQPEIMQFEHDQQVRCHLYTEKGEMVSVE
ncbi:ABC transporter ATP-binding protein [Lysinibacillus odysseyi]|uniref:Peptide ABC transporter ATP-binding protein n=1 Tax=Lysinibacillus odysseyi 34hs-1 = NBRC 100172 TaxID=1220589 RepID=A0A0A3IFJ8_9BACI|nr:ABC transporter ATP-binding protein [Lysinibacillus odysseyi]KGR82230.1 peptide ABC transporter ATP-binding protein [Lysinibacillus odysseyi 34hs-1 = NBRC 100172]